jgi:hypothetical protein
LNILKVTLTLLVGVGVMAYIRQPSKTWPRYNGLFSSSLKDSWLNGGEKQCLMSGLSSYPVKLMNYYGVHRNLMRLSSTLIFMGSASYLCSIEGKKSVHLQFKISYRSEMRQSKTSLPVLRCYNASFMRNKASFLLACA